MGKQSKRSCVSTFAFVFSAIIAASLCLTGCAADNQTQVAATVNGNAISEERVTDWIQSYRTNYQITDDDDFADFLATYNATPSDFRENAIRELAIRDLVTARADELGITVSDEEVEDYLNEMKGDKDTSEGSLWASVLESAGLTEDILRERYRYNLLQDKVLASDVEIRDATDEDELEYAQTYLAGTTQMHVAHIMVSGDDVEARAKECFSLLNSMADEGTLNAASFADVAKQYSSESDVATTGGVVGWTGSGLISDDVVEVMSEAEEGEVGLGSIIGPLESSEQSGAYEIAYVDEVFAFPNEDELTSIDGLNAPQELLDAVALAAKYVAYSNDCSSYLSNLYSSADVKINDMPSDVPYNVS